MKAVSVSSATFAPRKENLKRRVFGNLTSHFHYDCSALERSVGQVSALVKERYLVHRNSLKKLAGLARKHRSHHNFYAASA